MASAERVAPGSGPGPLPPPLAAKARRVAGVFLAMLGLSVLVDGHVAWLGVPLALAGGALFAWGLFEQAEPSPALRDGAADHIS